VNDITLNLIMIFIFSLLGLGIFLLVQRNQTKYEQQIRMLVNQNNWNLEWINEQLAKGLRISSPNWILEAMSRFSGRETGPGSTDATLLTTWSSDAPGSVIIIGARTNAIELGSIGDILGRTVIEMSLGTEAMGVQEIQIGSDAFKKHFMVWAKDIREAEGFLTPTIQSALLNWPKPIPVIKRTNNGLCIELRGCHLRKPADLLRLIQLGEKLL
jgi:hypothetical protein